MASPCRVTLLDLVWTVSSVVTSEAEVVAMVAYLINSGKVRLCGTFAGAKVELPAPAPVAPRATGSWRR